MIFLILIYLFMKETKGKNKEEIDEIFGKIEDSS